VVGPPSERTYWISIPEEVPTQRPGRVDIPVRDGSMDAAAGTTRRTGRIDVA
jgi:hypothetical protein